MPSDWTTNRPDVRIAVTTQSNTLQWAIVGPGRIARKFASDIQVTAGGHLRAVASRDMQHARTFAAEFGADLAYDDAAALAADPSVDIVYLAPPHNAHFPIAKMLLETGKPVLCEKPITVNAKQAAELIALSRSNKTFLMEAMWTRFLPLYGRIREWLDAGRIGKPQVVTSSFCFPANYNPSSRLFDPALAGGGLLDLGVYNISISQWVLRRKPDRVQATARFAATGVDELLAATLHYRDGALAQFVCGVTTAFDNSLVIGGDKGYIRVSPNFIHGREAVLHVGDTTETITESHRGGGFEYQIEEAMRCFRNGEIESPLLPHADILATMETMDEIRAQIGLRYPLDTV